MNKLHRQISLLLVLLMVAATFAAPGRINKKFVDADVTYVLKYIAKQMNKTLRIGPGVTGKITIELVDVTPEQALRMVLNAKSLHHAMLDNRTILVGIPQVADQEINSPISVMAAPEPRPAPPSTPSKRYYKPKRRAQVVFNTESYDHIQETGFRSVSADPLSTFSIDVDTAAYANLRRFINGGKKPPKDAVRIEELLNYFSYDFPRPKNDEPFAVKTELAQCPWNSEHQLLQIGVAAESLDLKNTPSKNLVFLLDVSGSMRSADKLPLLKGALKLLTRTLDDKDTVSIVVYAGASGVVLDPTPGSEGNKIIDALERLNAGGSTNGGAGINLAYKLAEQNFKKGAINRVILATDGDFNVGTASRGDLIRLIEEKRESGVFLSVLGFGRGNLKDSTMEQLANKGNGNYSYIDSLIEAKKVLVDEAGGTLVTVAKDVKLQVEFNPLKVASYRLIGYENRRLNNEDFDDDKKDAGEVGAGHTVTALYEIVPGKSKDSNLRYQSGGQTTAAAKSGELALLKLRYKAPDGDKSKLKEIPISRQARSFAKASSDFRFAASVASAGMCLRDSEFKGDAELADSVRWAKDALGKDRQGYRREFVRLMELVEAL